MNLVSYKVLFHKPKDGTSQPEKLKQVEQDKLWPALMRISKNESIKAYNAFNLSSIEHWVKCGDLIYSNRSNLYNLSHLNNSQPFINKALE